jgi:hypothetical protein
MLTKDEALKLISKRLEQSSAADNPLMVIDKCTIEKPFGWAFFNTKRFLETGISDYGIVGNGPIIVNKHTGAIKVCVSYKTVEESIKESEGTL